MQTTFPDSFGLLSDDHLPRAPVEAAPLDPDSVRIALSGFHLVTDPYIVNDPSGGDRQ